MTMIKTTTEAKTVLEACIRADRRGVDNTLGLVAEALHAGRNLLDLRALLGDEAVASLYRLEALCGSSAAVGEVLASTLWHSGLLLDRETGEVLRLATVDERARSAAADRDGRPGVVEVNGRPCYVVA